MLAYEVHAARSAKNSGVGAVFVPKYFRQSFQNPDEIYMFGKTSPEGNT